MPMAKLHYDRLFTPNDKSRETGLEDINDDLPEADFGPASLRVCSRA
jgi:hypothetical protein